MEGALIAINPGVPQAAINEALFKLRNIENGKLEQRNIIFTDYLQNGIEVAYFHNGEQKYERVHLIDYAHIDRNSFIVANQWTFQEHSEKRPDVVIFVNGLPLVVIELKSPSREETDASEAYRQLRNYMLEIPSFFVYHYLHFLEVFLSHLHPNMTFLSAIILKILYYLFKTVKNQ